MSNSLFSESEKITELNYTITDDTKRWKLLENHNIKFERLSCNEVTTVIIIKTFKGKRFALRGGGEEEDY